MNAMRTILRKLRSLRLYGVASKGRNLNISQPVYWSNRHCIHLGSDIDIRRGMIITPITNAAGRHFQPQVKIGNGVYIGHSVQIASMLEVSIGDGCVLSDYVYLNDAMHGMDPNAGPIMQQPLETKGPIRIGQRCFIGYGARVLSGVALGDDCIVGANAVVTRPFPAGSVVGGVPARLIKRREAAGPPSQ